MVSECDKLMSLPQFTYDVCCIDPRADNLHSNFVFSLYDYILKKKYQQFTTLQSRTVQVHAQSHTDSFSGKFLVHKLNTAQSSKRLCPSVMSHAGINGHL